MTTITASFTATFSERVRAIRAINRAAPAMIWFRRAAWIAAAVAIVLLATGEVYLATMFLLLPLILWPLLLLLPIYAAWLSRGNTLVNRGKHTYVFTSTGFQAKGPGSEAVFDWNGLHRVTKSRGYLLLFSSSQCAAAVPETAFSAPGAVDDVLELFANSDDLASPSEPEAQFGESLAEVSFGVTRKELYRAIVDTSRNGPPYWPFILWMVVLVAITTGPMVYRQIEAGGLLNVNLSLLALGLMPLVLILSIRPLASWWFARRMMRTRPTIASTQRIGVFQRGIHVGGPLYNGSYSWDSLWKLAETERFLLFFTSRATAIFLPKRMLSEHQSDDLRGDLKEYATVERKSLFEGDA